MDSNYTPADVARFWKKVDKSGGDDACWLWTASLNGEYGQIYWNGRPQLASRISYLLANGAYSDDLDVLHNCPNGDNPRCVNPKHLWLGTHLENMQDMALKNRAHRPRGEEGPLSKLNESQVAEIRHLYSLGGVSYKDLGVKYGVTAPAIGEIVRMETWLTDVYTSVKSGKGKLKGENHPLHKLTYEKIYEIRERSKSGKRGIQKLLAKEYGVDPAIIGRIIRGVIWKGDFS